jgi:Uma2 family endonuclease
MLAVEERTRRGADLLREPPSLQNGDRLRSKEFLRRYEAMPEVKKAELIEGIVYMGSPVSAEEHGEPDAFIHTWLGTYAAHTPGVRVFANTTVILDADNTPQPDACLCLNAGRGGRTRISPKKYLMGAPELIVEIAASGASIDLNDKMDAYARNGVGEYLVWRTLEKRFDWFSLENENYVAVRPDGRGLLRSKTFPGLVLDVRALLAMNAPKVLTVLQRALASAAHKSFAASPH